MHLSYNGKTYDFQGHAGSCRVYMKFGDDNYLLGNQTYNLLNNSSFDDPSTRPPFFHGIPAQNYSKLPFFMDFAQDFSRSWNPKQFHQPTGAVAPAKSLARGGSRHLAWCVAGAVWRLAFGRGVMGLMSISHIECWVSWVAVGPPFFFSLNVSDFLWVCYLSHPFSLNLVDSSLASNIEETKTNC